MKIFFVSAIGSGAVSAVGSSWIAISRKRSRARGSALVGETEIQGEIKLWQAKVQTNQVLYGTFLVMQKTVRITNSGKLGAAISCSSWASSQRMPEALTSIPSSVGKRWKQLSIWRWAMKVAIKSSGLCLRPGSPEREGG